MALKLPLTLRKATRAVAYRELADRRLVCSWPDRRSGRALRVGSNEGGPYVADYDVPNEISVNNGLTPTAIHQSIQGGHLMRNGF
jgi:hypothetical protein